MSAHPHLYDDRDTAGSHTRKLLNCYGALRGLDDVSRAAALLSDQFWDPDTRAAVDQLIKRFWEKNWQSRIEQLNAGNSVYRDEPCRPDTPPLPSSISPSLCAP